MLSNIIGLVSGCVTFLGGFLIVWGAVSLGLAIRADTHDRIELRSDKVRHIIGTRPPAAVRYGTLIVVAVMTLIIIAAAIYFGQLDTSWLPA